jgi:hypothetical protein
MLRGTGGRFRGSSLRATDYEISFSGEDPGWQVSVDGDIAHLNTDELIAQVARQIEERTSPGLPRSGFGSPDS